MLEGTQTLVGEDDRNKCYQAGTRSQSTPRRRDDCLFFLVSDLY